jgi:hypothetical protein
MEKMLDSSNSINYNNVMSKPVGDYMIDLTMERMTKIEAVLAQSKSAWAKRHWSETLEYFKRQLKQLGSQP